VKEQVVLVVEVEPLLRRVLHVALRSHGYEVIEAASGREALALQRSRLPQAMLLDLELPDMDGVDVIKAARRSFGLPILVLSGRSDEPAIIQALDAGANDYITKPFREGELMARLRAALRPLGSQMTPREAVAGDVAIDLVDHRVRVRGREVLLTPTEFKLLALLAQEAGRVVSHQRLLLQVWGAGAVAEVQYLRVFMKQLRAKIEEEPARPRRIVTVAGVGYRLVPQGDAAA
jgi:two-component system, OmpR family, KDP operon response regulator KdpE